MSDNFIWSVKNNDCDAVKETLDKKTVDVNELVNGRAAIHFAADYGQTEMIDILLNAGADIDKKDKHGITPVLAAIWEGHVSAVKLLLSKGADKNGKAPDDRKYMECAETDEMKALLI